MRANLAALFALVMVSSVDAQPAKKPLAKPAPKITDKLITDKPIDVSAVSEKLAVFKDEVGSFYVIPKPGTFEKEQDHSWVFYGDGKTMFQQRILNSSKQKGGHEYYAWAPRAKDMTSGVLRFTDTETLVQCRSGKTQKRALTAVAANEASALFTSAKFYPPPHPRAAHFIARDDEATYYYVDELREDLGGNGFRLYTGLKGAMKQIALTNIASDSAGEIFVTKQGKLKLVAPKPVFGGNPPNDPSAFWIKGSKKTELTVLPIFDNRYLIYRELGIYGQLGAICDDQ